jgi:cytochrome P450
MVFTLAAQSPVGPDNHRPSLYDLQRPEVIADPWIWYDQLRALSPYWDPTLRTWLVAGHRDVVRLLADADFTAAMDHRRVASFAPPVLRHLFPLLDAHVSFVDGPDHARLRRALAEPFKPRQIQALEDYVAGVVDAALDRRSGHLDVVSDLAYPIPLRVVAHLLGLSGVDLATLRRWSNAWGDVIAAPGHLPTGDTRELLVAVNELIACLRETVAAQRKSPDDTITARLVASTDAGQLTEDELIANLMMLVTAGHETTANLISNAVAALLDDPRLYQQLRQTPELLSAAVDELARLHPPTQYTARTARSDTEIAGRRIQAGQSVVLLLAAANRDPAAFDEPDQVRLDRPPTVRPVAFGFGPHFCFGAPLARTEVRLTLAGLFARYPELHSAGPRRWRPNANLRGLESLPITVTGGEPSAQHSTVVDGPSLKRTP